MKAVITLVRISQQWQIVNEDQKVVFLLQEAFGVQYEALKVV